MDARGDTERQDQKRGVVGVAIISSKVTERRLKLFGHVKRRPLEHACGQIMDTKPPGSKTKDEVDGFCRQRHENG